MGGLPRHRGGYIRTALGSQGSSGVRALRKPLDVFRRICASFTWLHPLLYKFLEGLVEFHDNLSKLQAGCEHDQTKLLDALTR